MHIDCKPLAAAMAALLIAGPALAQTTVQYAGAVAAHAVKPIPVRFGGRGVPIKGIEPALRRQWPASYVETAIRGTGAVFRVGEGDVRLNVRIDGKLVTSLVKPKPGFYRIAGPAPGTHRLRLEVASESQKAATVLGGFYAPSGTVAAPLPRRALQIEFIGDSHTVGYGNRATKQACSEEEVWQTTDSSEAPGPLLARRHDADYRVNAISGRGVVRNYNGFAADPLPVAYPFALLDHGAAADDTGWDPSLIVIALGTNDFTTALHEGERWKTRDALHADFEARYVAFVQMLHARHPKAAIVLWATDMAGGEIEGEVARVAETLRGGGVPRLAFVPVHGLGFTGCHSHPSVADDEKIADAIDRAATGLGVFR